MRPRHARRCLAGFAVVVFAACARAAPSNAPIGPEGSVQFALVQRFWRAARAGDRASLREIASADAAAWAALRDSTAPGYFEGTADRLELSGGYQEEEEEYLVAFRVPHVSCPPPVHDGERDELYARLVLTLRGWFIEDVWQDGC
jgi:hypothetical protein